MALEDDIRVLSETPLLSELGRDALRLIAFSADHVRLSRGDVLFRQDDPADCGFVVVAGRLTLERNGQETVVGRASLIGELALVADILRPATATAREPLVLLRIARESFGRLFTEYPELARKLHSRLAARVQNDIIDLKKIEAALRK